MDILKNLAATMSRQLERDHTPVFDSQWRKAAHQRVMDHVNEMIADGRARNIKTISPMPRTELSIEEQNRLDDMEDGVFG